MQLAIVGSRNPLVVNQLSSLRHAIRAAHAAGWHIATGCCPGGADNMCRAICAAEHIPCTVYSVPAHLTTHAPALRARTTRLVHESTALVAFPAGRQYVRSGSWLAIFLAASMGMPVAVCPGLRHISASQLPCCRNVISWQLGTGLLALQLPFGPWFFPVVQSTQINLFTNQE